MRGALLSSRLAVAVVALGTATIAAIAFNARSAPPPIQLRASDPVADTVITAPTVPTTTTSAAPPTTAAAPVAAPVHAAQADRVVTTRNPQAVGTEALAMITYPWRDRLNVTIAFAGPRAGYRATSTAYSGRNDLVVYIRSTDTPRLVAVNIAHELGHLVDYHRLTDADRKEWLNARGRPDVTWWACNYCQDYATGSGDFAETFAAWQVGGFDYRSRVAPLPSPSEMAALSRFFK